MCCVAWFPACVRSIMHSLTIFHYLSIHVQEPCYNVYIFYEFRNRAWNVILFCSLFWGMFQERKKHQAIWHVTLVFSSHGHVVLKLIFLITPVTMTVRPSVNIYFHQLRMSSPPKLAVPILNIISQKCTEIFLWKTFTKL